MITVPPSATLAEIKEEALSALISDVNQVEDVPKVTSGDDFEICRAAKDKGKPTGEFEALDLTRQVRDYGLSGWDTLYLQFRDSSGDLLPVTFSQPTIEDEDEEPPIEEDFPMSSTSKGKRKAQFDD
ncbi:hypothetical protein BDZ94DRAFT_759086 [Collybia nuda]|uniref:Uncharacterized protein n=1 Tax=Collybia nuda TaxID=64659 RepID=A0A9P5Y4B5_9AGAR|nr:hypothetical protein BDZ94DRAFT_759086 [Collybia nuda]